MVGVYGGGVWVPVAVMGNGRGGGNGYWIQGRVKGLLVRLLVYGPLKGP